ncbi:hypothetical protein COB64_01875 [Candidatus Wolfebacteria bacterium]|nr:MAG: hypothetical protein COB64_01875 [Candidatus Wolfebacteria bacterium]
MIYFFYGDNSSQKKDAYNALLQSLNASDKSLYILDDSNFTHDTLKEHISSSSLFSSESIIVLENILEKKENEEYILSQLKDMKNSKNVFIVLERSALKKVSDRFNTHSEEVKSFILPKEVKTKSEFNIFSLTDAYGRRDKKNVWTLYQKALRKGVLSEEVINILFWYIKSLLLVKEKKNNPESVKQTGLNPYVFKKAFAASSNFRLVELKKISSQLVALHHGSRTSNRDTSIDVEHFILTSL